jgi:hypothetical protein
MKNLQSLLTEKGINVLVNDQMFMVRGGSKKNCKVSVKSMGSNKSFGSKNSGKCKNKATSVSAPNTVSTYIFPSCF